MKTKFKNFSGASPKIALYTVIPFFLAGCAGQEFSSDEINNAIQNGELRIQPQVFKPNNPALENERTLFAIAQKFLTQQNAPFSILSKILIYIEIFVLIVCGINYLTARDFESQQRAKSNAIISIVGTIIFWLIPFICFAIYNLL